MSSGADIRSEQQARAILKLAAGDPPSTWRAAFQRQAKASHPDQGGDAEREKSQPFFRLFDSKRF